MTASHRDHWIPWYFVIFFLALTLIYATMVTIAIRTQTGIVTQHPYEQGLAYNHIVQASEKQTMLQWKGDIHYDSISRQKGKLSFILHDASGNLLVPEKVSASITRPTQAGMDFTLPLQAAPSGMFETDITFPQEGLWEIRIYTQSPEGTYQQSRRLVLE